MTDLSESLVDLAAVAVLLAAFDAVVLAHPAVPSALRTALAVPVLLVLPGYALVSALYPDLPVSSGRSADGQGWSLTGAERVALSVAASLAIVGGAALAANFTSYGVRLLPILAGVTAVTTVLTVLAGIRRFQTPPEQRFRLPVGAAVAGAVGRYLNPSDRAFRQTRPFEVQTPGQRRLNLLLVAALLVLASSVAYAAVSPSPAEQSFSELTLLSENASGDLVAADYPRNFSRGERRPITVAVANHEGRPVNYTVVVAAQDVTVADGRRQVRASAELGRFSRRVAPGESVRVRQQIGPAVSAPRQRVVVLLYKGAAPPDPSTENAYRSARVWIAVDGAGAGGG